MIDQPLPSSLTAEEALLGCFFHNPVSLLADAAVSVPVDAFYHPAHRLIYEEMMAFMRKQDANLDSVTFPQHLTDKGLIDKVGGHGFLGQLYGSTSTPDVYNYYKGIALEKLMLRRTIIACEEGITKAYEYQEDVPAAIASISSAISEALRPIQGAARKSFKDDLVDYVGQWEDRMNGKVEAGIPTRWDSFNRTFGGITPCLWLVSGFPSRGKSTFAQNLMEDVLAHGKHGIWFSYEMDKMEHFDRLVVAQTGIQSQKVFFPAQNLPTQEDARAITRGIARMQGWNLHLRPEPGWTIEQIEAESRTLCQKHDVGLIIIDYLQLVLAGGKFNTRAEQVASVSRNCKRISAVNRVAVCLLSQLNDDGKTLDSRAPGQDASNAVSIEIDTEEGTGRNRTTKRGGIHVMKNRNGKRGHMLPITLDGEIFSFRERKEDEEFEDYHDR